MKKILVILSAVSMFLLVACGETTATTAQADSQPAAAVETPTEVETAKVEPEVTSEEPETEVITEEPIEEISEEPETEVATEEVSEEPTEANPMEALLNSDMGEYISDGAFDIEKFAKDTGSKEHYVDNYPSLTFVYNGWFIQTGWCNGDHQGTCYVVLGTGSDFVTGSDVTAKYSYLFPGEDEDNIDINNQMVIPIEGVIHLKDVFSAINENGLDEVPNIDGANFRPCDPADETIQY